MSPSIVEASFVTELCLRYLTKSRKSITTSKALFEAIISSSMVALEALDGSLVKSGTYGRGQHGLSDAKISRQQFSITESALEALTVRNLGQNRKFGAHCRRLNKPKPYKS